MTAFAAAVADTLLPGEGDGPGALPPASRALADLGHWAGTHAPVLDAIRGAGGEDTFLRAGAGERAAAARRAEADHPAAFAGALLALLGQYYGSPEVLHALGWPAGPPQPDGHRVTETGPDTWARLERVRARGRSWR